MVEKQSNQLALPLDSGFGEDALDLRSHGIVRHTDQTGDFPWRMTVTQQ
jgi:hypothetical protein